MPRSHATVAAALALLSGCGEPTATRVEIAAHYVPACAPAPEAAPTLLALSALGDFDPSNESVAILRSDAAGQALELPEGTLGAELSALDGEPYWGSGALDAHSRLPILLWPVRRACRLMRLEASQGEAWLAGGSDRLGVLLVVGASSGAHRVDLVTGAAAPLESSPRVPRRAATWSELGDQLLLAGGVDATRGGALGSGELFDPALDRFTGATIALAQPRAHHAAVSLPGGASLLIGGESERGEPLRSVEVVTPGAGGSARAYELLVDARVAPRAVLLGQDRVLVGGGYTRRADGGRAPLESVELLRTDQGLATEPVLALSPPALDRAFVALGPGSALAVGGCEPREAPGPDCTPCELGCVSRHVFWLDSRGQQYALEPLPEALAVPAPELVPGSGGRPWLIAGARLARFDPWRERFESVEPGLPGLGTSSGAPLSLRPGSFAWLAASEVGVDVMGMYHDQRGPWARDVAPLVVGSAAGLVPDRPPSSSAGEVRLEHSAAGGLVLSGPEAIVSVADTRYGPFRLELVVTEGPAPLVRLLGPRGEAAAYGGLECPWPGAGGPGARLLLSRERDQVRLERSDAPGSALFCQRPLPERVSVQLIGTRDGVTRVSRVELARSAE